MLNERSETDQKYETFVSLVIIYDLIGIVILKVKISIAHVIENDNPV